MEELLPWLYLKGVSTGDFSEALKALLGPDAPGLSATTITRLKSTWEEEYKDKIEACGLEFDPEARELVGEEEVDGTPLVRSAGESFALAPG